MGNSNKFKEMFRVCGAITPCSPNHKTLLTAKLNINFTSFHNFVSHNLVKKFTLPERYCGCEVSVWTEFQQLALQAKPLVDLSQSCSDFAPPKYVLKMIEDVANLKNKQSHQYTTGVGLPRLLLALSKFYSQLTNRELDPSANVTVTSGDWESLYSCIIGNVSPGDEVILIEPFFDCYKPMVKIAGGKAVFVSLRPEKSTQPGNMLSSKDWILDFDELASKFNTKTKAIILNNPHNPIGKVFSLQELTEISKLCQKWDVLCISDEMNEHIVYQPKKHIRVATLPDMWKRTVTIGSVGKLFSVSGWQISWVYGPPNFITNVKIGHRNCVATNPTPLQEVLARVLELEMPRLNKPECHFEILTKEFESKRDFTVKFLKDVDMTPIVPEGGCCLLADWTSFSDKIDLSAETDKYKDYRFAKWMSKNVKIQGIPSSAFCNEDNKHQGERYINLHFIKRNEILLKAAQILTTFKENLKK